MKKNIITKQKDYKFIARQGDIIIKQIDKLPKSLVKIKGDIILHGEATGHAHRIKNGVIFKDKSTDNLYLFIARKGEIVHEEHGAINLPKGNYAVLRTREYDYSSRSTRLVQD